MVLTHMTERRGAQKDAKICESASDTGTMSASADESSSSNGSPPGLFDKKGICFLFLTQVRHRAN